MSVHIASYDWEHSLWTGDYYPSDLPPDWRLGYFSNDFDAVVVPAYRWRGADAACLERWFADAGANFAFYWEVDGADPQVLEALPGLLTLFSTSSRPVQAGFVLHGVSSVERYAGLAALLRPYGPVCLLPPFEQLAEPTCAADLRSDGLVALAVNGRGEPLTLRRCLEQVASRVGSEGHGLLLCLGAPPGLDCLRNAATLVSLMGM